MPTLATLGTYAGAFLFIVTLVALGYQPPQKIDDGVANASPISLVSDETIKPSVDQLVATAIAGDLTERAHLPIASNVAELSVSLAVKNELAQNDETIISKPQIVQPTAGTREIRTYTTKPGDTAQAVAAKFNISSTTLKWSNNLTYDALDSGKKLTIPPVDGVVYTVRRGDTIDSLAARYKVDKARLIAFNDLELGGLKNGRRIILPGALLPTTERPGYEAPTNYGYRSGTNNYLMASAGNRYAPGFCTWYAYERRAAAGRPIGSFWGNAVTWAANARAAGFLVNNTPAPGAIMQNGGGYGHVAYVESVGSDGNVTVREMNYAGYNVISSRTLSAGQAANYNFIH